MQTPHVTVVWLAQGERDVPAGSGWLGGAEAMPAGRRPSTKRLGEARLRRWTAKRALALHLGLPQGEADLARIEVRHDADGAPAPFLDGARAEATLSLTDRDGRAVCALASAHVALGCDLERVEPRSPEFAADFFTPAEQLLLSESPAADRPLLANLLWSAKESALKALRTGLRRDTRSVEVALAGEPPQDGWRRITITPAEGGRLHGWWRRDGGFLLTVAAGLPFAPPRALWTG